MVHKLFDLIKKYDSIIVARHKNPDLDAYGSQFGLYYALKEKYKDKNIYIVGDTNNLNYFGDFDDVSLDTRKESLVIILDTVAKQMLREIDYTYYKELVLVDHHRNDPDIEHDIYIKDINASSTAEIVADMLLKENVGINRESAKSLYMGIIGDTGRFRFSSTTSKTFMIASKLMESGINLQEIHDLVYLETFEDKKIKSIFFESVELTKQNVAYRKNKKEFLEKYNLKSHYVSRALVGQMAGIKEIPIWVNFTYDPEEENIKCELRSRDYEVLKVAKKYGGGGHLRACGCSINTWEETDKVLKDLDLLLEEEK
ncbi:MAG: bifunctional oligoribonuclease/PAP phosphatase NrnA [Tenericutes bacterium]|jgi:phosphoesterase RecJ-like protein|nr:bifunctional oligoribonuclease/PAP phosphatase NrnA [Mycoplasmatota bacterium]